MNEPKPTKEIPRGFTQEDAKILQKIESLREDLLKQKNKLADKLHERIKELVSDVQLLRKDYHINILDSPIVRETLIPLQYGYNPNPSPAPAPQKKQEKDPNRTVRVDHAILKVLPKEGWTLKEALKALEGNEKGKYPEYQIQGVFQKPNKLYFVIKDDKLMRK